MTRPERPRSRYQVLGAAFKCEQCGRTVSGSEFGSEHRNHCPWCLWSLHVDLRPGDRRSGCRGPMEPIAVWVKGGREWAIVHRCRRCGMIRSNRIAGDDNELVLMSMALRPLSEPPFSLDRVTTARKHVNDRPPQAMKDNAAGSHKGRGLHEPMGKGKAIEPDSERETRV